MEQLIQVMYYPQLILVTVYCYYLVLASKFRLTPLKLTMLAGAGLLAGTLAYNITFNPTGALKELLFQLATMMVFGSLLAFEYKHTQKI